MADREKRHFVLTSRVLAFSPVACGSYGYLLKTRDVRKVTCRRCAAILRRKVFRG